MPSSRFDAFTRIMAGARNRRTVITSLASMAALVWGGTEAKPRKKKPTKKKPRPCGVGTKRCGTTCVNITVDPVNCGDCGVKCATGQACVDGQCTCDGATCDGCCDGSACRAGTSDSACGRNGAVCDVCTTGEACQGRSCVCVPQANACGQRECGSVADGCGGLRQCGTCEAGQECSGAGICTCTLASCDGCCVGATCVDTQTSEEHCGSCGNACGAGQSCRNGSCVLRVCPTCPFQTVQDAVDAAGDGATIDVDAGLFVGDVLIDKDITLTGAGKSQTTLQGGGAGSVVRIRFGTTVRIQGVTIRGGDADRGLGGGVFNLGTLTLEDSTVSDNRAGSSGGGIANAANLTVRRCIIKDNAADGSGGGIYNDSDFVIGLAGTLVIDETIVRNNGAAIGGGIYNVKGTTDIRNGCEITNNEAYRGGGIGIGGGSLTVADTLLRRNYALVVGGAAVHEGSNPMDLSFTDCTFEDNEAEEQGGAIYYTGQITLSRCTIRRNTARDGGGLLSYAATTGTTLSGCTITDNRAKQGGGVWMERSQLTLTNSTVTGNTATNADPALAGGGIYVVSQGTSTVTLNGTSAVTGNTPNNCLNTVACPV